MIYDASPTMARGTAHGKRKATEEDSLVNMPAHQIGFCR